MRFQHAVVVILAGVLMVALLLVGRLMIMATSTSHVVQLGEGQVGRDGFRVNASFPITQAVGHAVHLRMTVRLQGGWWPYNPALSLQGNGAWRPVPVVDADNPSHREAGPFCPGTDQVSYLFQPESERTEYIDVGCDGAVIDLTMIPLKRGPQILSIAAFMHRVGGSGGMLDLHELQHPRPLDRRARIRGFSLVWKVNVH